MDLSGDYRCSHTDFQGKADIPNTHVGISLVERLNLLQRIKVAFHISNVCFLWHDWFVSKISHLDFLSVLYAPCFQEDHIRKHITKGRMIQTFSRTLIACHLQINNTLTAARTQFINLLTKRVEVSCSVAKLTACLTA